MWYFNKHNVFFGVSVWEYAAVLNECVYATECENAVCSLFYYELPHHRHPDLSIGLKIIRTRIDSVKFVFSTKCLRREASSHFYNISHILLEGLRIDRGNVIYEYDEWFCMRCGPQAGEIECVIQPYSLLRKSIRNDKEFCFIFWSQLKRCAEQNPVASRVGSYWRMRARQFQFWSLYFYIENFWARFILLCWRIVS